MARPPKRSLDDIMVTRGDGESVLVERREDDATPVSMIVRHATERQPLLLAISLQMTLHIGGRRTQR